MFRSKAFFFVVFLIATLPALSQFADQRYALSDAERTELSTGSDRLRASLEALKEQSERTHAPRPDQIPDAEIFLNAVDLNLRQSLFFSKQNVDQAHACLREGDARVKELQAVRSSWERETGVVTFGYRSKIDGSAQPYQLFIPPGYDNSKPGRLDVFLHGRLGTMNEPAFIRSSQMRSAYGPDTPSHLALFPYGRGNNGWRFAGEQDAFEALADVQRRFKIDPNLIMLRGFSMGGLGAWHIGLQHPGTWASVSPGAGFVDTVNYQKWEGLPAGFKPELLHLYDPLDYAANAASVSLLPYVGEIDPVFPQHKLMMDQLAKLGIPAKQFVGPQTPHRYDPATLKDLLAAISATHRIPDSSSVDFITYTLRWPECKWVRIEGLERQWDRAEVHARITAPGRAEIKLLNVTALTITPPPGSPATAQKLQVIVDSSEPQNSTVTIERYTPGKPVHLVNRGGRWTIGEQSGLRKKPGLQGPVDDALFGPVLMVTGSGTSWSLMQEDWLEQEVVRFKEGWSIYFRAALPEKRDTAVTPEDIRDRNLYLFGDPGSNSVLKRLLPKLPLQWTKDRITIAGKKYSTKDHLPMLIFPNPENPERYIVINTGFTFSRADWYGSNARQYPHLPDYAVIRFDPHAFSDDRSKDTVLSGFFDEHWRIKRN
jgi:pimeloyl-ACP methyl ester carboxylesterase